MPMNRPELLKAALAGAFVESPVRNSFAVPGGSIEVAIDAARVGVPITPLIFGPSLSDSVQIPPVSINIYEFEVENCRCAAYPLGGLFSVSLCICGES